MIRCLVVVLLLLVARTASAHPAGFTSVNRYIGVQGGAAIHIAYVLDFAEMPSTAEIDLADTNHDGNLDPDEQTAYLATRLPPLVSAWVLDVDGERAHAAVLASHLDIVPGERGLPTLRITAEVGVDRRPKSDEARVHIIDKVFADRTGWREIAADGQPPLAYEPGRPPPRIDEAKFTIRAGGKAASAAPPIVVDNQLARLSRAMKEASTSTTFTLLALFLALALGAAHALSPGHGKSLAAAYLVGRRANAGQAILFGVTVTVAHTAVVFVVGLFAVAIERSIGSDRLFHGIEVVSALSVLVLGGVQLSRRWHELTTGHDHVHERADSIVALGASAGLAPCPSALAILLTATAIHRYAFGLVLVLAFSLGVATTLTVVGLVVVSARGLVERADPRLRRWLPVVSSACVLVIGVFLCAAAL